METTGISNAQNVRKKRKPNQNYLKTLESNRESFKSCGSTLIVRMLMMTMRNGVQMCDELCAYMDELLHSIFFLGHVHDQRFFTPNMLFKMSEVLEDTRKHFPEPFKKYKSHLPSRTPFSILMHMMELLHGTEEKIIDELQTLLKELKFPNPLHKPGSKYENYYTLEATVICVCYSYTHPQKYYGASLSCRKGNAKRIMIDVSCLHTWHEFISHAVMSFTLSPPGDGITFPESVKCQAYFRDWNKSVYKEKHPCLYCKQLFNLKDVDLDKEPDHPYGNCAETECLSKLLLGKQDIRGDVKMENYTEKDMEKLRTLTKANLIKELGAIGINMSHENILFYSQMPNTKV